MPEIHWTLTIGELMQVAVIFFGGAAFYTSTRERLTAIERDLSSLKDVLIILARQDERIKAVEKLSCASCSNFSVKA